MFSSSKFKLRYNKILIVRFSGSLFSSMEDGALFVRFVCQIQFPCCDMIHCAVWQSIVALPVSFKHLNEGSHQLRHSNVENVCKNNFSMGAVSVLDQWNTFKAMNTSRQTDRNYDKRFRTTWFPRMSDLQRSFTLVSFSETCLSSLVCLYCEYELNTSLLGSLLLKSCDFFTQAIFCKNNIITYNIYT